MIESMLLGEFLKIPFVHGGRELTGADCYGIIMLWYRMRLGIELFDPDFDYPEGPQWKDKSYFLENYHLQWERVESPRKNDVVLFKSKDGKLANHAGIYLGKNKFLHTIKRTGCVIQKLDQWSDRVEGYYRFKR